MNNTQERIPAHSAVAIGPTLIVLLALLTALARRLQAGCP